MICLHWVDQNLQAHEELIGLYAIDNTRSFTLGSIRDTLLHLNLSINNCWGHCYNGASNMVGSKAGISTQIQNDENHAILTHC
jgi:hypothetical protein